MEARPRSCQSLMWLLPSATTSTPSSSRAASASGGVCSRNRFWGYAASPGKSPTTDSRLTIDTSAAANMGANSDTTARASSAMELGRNLAVSSRNGSRYLRPSMTSPPKCSVVRGVPSAPKRQNMRTARLGVWRDTTSGSSMKPSAVSTPAIGWLVTMSISPSTSAGWWLSPATNIALDTGRPSSSTT